MKELYGCYYNVLIAGERSCPRARSVRGAIGALQLQCMLRKPASQACLQSQQLTHGAARGLGTLARYESKLAPQTVAVPLSTMNGICRVGCLQALSSHYESNFCVAGSCACQLSAARWMQACPSQLARKTSAHSSKVSRGWTDHASTLCTMTLVGQAEKLMYTLEVMMESMLRSRSTCPEWAHGTLRCLAAALLRSPGWRGNASCVLKEGTEGRELQTLSAPRSWTLQGQQQSHKCQQSEVRQE